MIGITLPQPAASALVYGVERGAAWPSGWPLRPDVVGQYIAIHSTVAWSAEHARRASLLGLDDCPRGQVVGLAQVAGWARMSPEGPQWLGDPAGPSWASQAGILDRRALLERWPLGVESAALFVDDAVPLTASALGIVDVDDSELVCFGDASGPWVVPESLVRSLRLRWGAPQIGPPTSATTGRPSGGKPAPRCSKPPTDDARANAEMLADLLPEGWSTRVSGFTVGIVDPTGRCHHSLVRPVGRADLADMVVRLVMRFGAGRIDAAVDHVRRRCPWVKPEERTERGAA